MERLTQAYVRLPWLGLGAALLAFLGLQCAAGILAGTFEYPLDDVYIHLAMAEGLAHGTYGFNPGEAASAASSILYPVLLLPFPGTEVQRLLPLFWNLIAVAACGWLWGRVVAQADRTRADGLGRMGWVLALAGPIALNMHGVAFTGMENSLHTAASLMIVLGCADYLTSGRVSPALILAVIAAPLLRYEGLALSLGAVGLIALGGRWRLGASLALAVLLPVAAFSAALLAMGLDALPVSVLAKTLFAAPDLSTTDRAIGNLFHSLGAPEGRYLLALTLVALGLACWPRVALRPLLLLAGLAGVAHLLFAHLGWMHRYEHYILVTLAAAILLGLAPLPGRVPPYLSLVLLLPGLGCFQPPLFREYIYNPAAIHRQQAQMARFVHDYWRAPVAVNDLGWMAWQNDNYVLDLWGLASTEVLKLRLRAQADGWAAPLMARHGVDVAIIYEAWLGAALGPGWVPVADLTMDQKIGKLGDWRVTFYAATPARATQLHMKLTEFAPSLPPGTGLTFRDAPQGRKEKP
jgi:hypothetical protein